MRSETSLPLLKTTAELMDHRCLRENQLLLREHRMRSEDTETVVLRTLMTSRTILVVNLIRQF